MIISPFVAPVFCRPIMTNTLFSRQIISRNTAGSVYDWAGVPLIFLNPDLGQVYAEGTNAQVTLILRLLFTLNQWKGIQAQAPLGLFGSEKQVLKMADSHLQELYQQNRDEYYQLINLRQQIMEVKDREKKAASGPKVTKKESKYINDTHVKIENQIKQALGIKDADDKPTPRTGKGTAKAKAVKGARDKQSTSAKDQPARKALPGNQLLRQQYTHTRDIAALPSALRLPAAGTTLNQIGNYSRYLTGGLLIPGRPGQDTPGGELPARGTDLFPVMLVLNKAFQQWLTGIPGDMKGPEPAPGISATVDNEPPGIPDSIKQAYKQYHQLAAHLASEFSSTESYRFRMLLDEEQAFFNTREYLDQVALVTWKTTERSVSQEEEYRQYRQGMREETHRLIAGLFLKNIDRSATLVPFREEVIAEQVTRRLQSFINVKAGVPSVIIPEYGGVPAGAVGGGSTVAGGGLAEAAGGELPVAGEREQLIRRTGLVFSENRNISISEALTVSRTGKTEDVRLDGQETGDWTQLASVRALTNLSEQTIRRMVKLLQGMTRYEERGASAGIGSVPTGGVMIGGAAASRIPTGGIMAADVAASGVTIDGVTAGGRPAESVPIIIGENWVFKVSREGMAGQGPEKEMPTAVYEEHSSLVKMLLQEAGLSHPFQVLRHLVLALERTQDITSQTIKSPAWAGGNINRSPGLLFNPEARRLYPHTGGAQRLTAARKFFRQPAPDGRYADEYIATADMVFHAPEEHGAPETSQPQAGPRQEKKVLLTRTALPISWAQAQREGIFADHSRYFSTRMSGPAMIYHMPPAGTGEGDAPGSSQVINIMESIYAHQSGVVPHERLFPIQAEVSYGDEAAGLPGRGITNIMRRIYGQPGLVPGRPASNRTGIAGRDGTAGLPGSVVANIMRSLYAHQSEFVPGRTVTGQTGIPGRDGEASLPGDNLPHIIRSLYAGRLGVVPHHVAPGRMGAAGSDGGAGLPGGDLPHIMRSLYAHRLGLAPGRTVPGRIGVPGSEVEAGLPGGGLTSIMRNIYAQQIEAAPYYRASGQAGMPGDSIVNIMRSIYAYRPWLAQRRGFPGQARAVAENAAGGLTNTNIMENIYFYGHYDQYWSEPYRRLSVQPPALDTPTPMTVYQRPRENQERGGSPPPPWETAPTPVYLASGQVASPDMLTMHEAGIQHLKKERRQTQEQVINQERVIQNLTEKLEDQTAIIKELSTKVGKKSVPPVDVKAITDQVMQRFQRQLRLERQRRGMD